MELLGAEWPLLLRQALLFVHLLAFAVAISTVLRTDLALLRGSATAARQLDRAARLLALLLALLWFSGLLLVALDMAALGPDWVLSDKLAAKLLVVLALTLNGAALHALVLPALGRALALPALGRQGAAAGLAAIGPLPLLLGAVSTTSWLYAGFIGVSRVMAPVLDLREYLLLYGAALLLAAVAVLVGLRPVAAVCAAGRGAEEL